MANFTGTSGNDSFAGTSADDNASGQGSSDSLSGAAGNDILDGGDGDDTLNGGEGDDTLTGGLGNDNLSDGAGDDIVDGGDGSDWIYTYYGTDVIDLGVGNDWANIYRSGPAAEHVTLSLGDGNDTLRLDALGATTYTLDFGSGDDVWNLTYLQSHARATLGSGVDRINIWHGGNGTIGAGTVTFTDFEAGAAGDRINWVDFLASNLTNWSHTTNPFATGHLRLRQAGLNAVLEIDKDGGGNGYVTLFTFENSSASAFTLENFDGYPTDGTVPAGMNLSGSAAPDILDGAAGDDTIDGLGDYDEIQGGAGNDTLNGGEGNDVLKGEIGDDVLNGDAGNDRLDGGHGNDQLNGGDGHDSLDSLQGSDVLDGGAGDDTLYFAATSTALTRTGLGGDGNDSLLLYGYHGGSFIVDGGAGRDRIVVDSLRGVADLTLGADADTILFSEYSSNFLATMGSVIVRDFASGVGGDQIDFANFLSAALTGWDGSGNPFAASLGYLRLVQSGADVLLQIDTSGGGNSYRTVLTFKDSEAATFTADNFGGFPPDGSPPAGKTLIGTDWSDELRGGGGDDVIEGRGSGDTLYGGAGADLLKGGAGGDFMRGEAGNDELQGEAGNDHLDGGAGNDVMDGGEGDDSFLDDYGSDTIVGGAGNDRITVQRFGSQTDAVSVDAGADDDTVSLHTYNQNVTIAADAGSGNDSVEISAMNGHATVTLGAGADRLSIGAAFVGSSGGSVQVLDFAGGPGGDSIGFVGYLLEGAKTWDSASNPYTTGFARLVQSGNDTLVQVDRDSAGTVHGFLTLATLRGVSAASLTLDNLGYLPPLAIHGSAGADTAAGTDAAETFLFSQGGADTVSGGGGDDTVFMGGAYTAADQLSGGAGIDRLVLKGNYSTATGIDAADLSGFETLSLLSTIDPNFGTAAFGSFHYNLQLALSAGSALTVDASGLGSWETLSLDASASQGVLTVTGGAGDDRLRGGGADDVLTGGAGNDTYVLDHVGDTIVELAGGGSDTVVTATSYTLAGEIENLTLSGVAAIDGAGTDGANRITGNGAMNVLRGHGGDDVLDGGAGGDRLHGGSGDDLYYVDHSGDDVFEDSNGGTDTVIASISHTLDTSVENLVLAANAGAIAGTGNGFQNVITGNASANVLDGGGAVDTLIGGGGNDTYHLDSTSETVVELAGGGTDTIRIGASYTLGAHVETLVLTGTDGLTGTGNSLDNVIYGNDGANLLNGGGGTDSLYGGLGDDTYVVDQIGDRANETDAAGGDDLVLSSVSFWVGAYVERLTLTGTANVNAVGNELANVLTGNSGNNTLSGHLGADTMAGGLGHDIYVVDQAGDVVVEAASAGTDRVDSAIDYTLGANLENLTLTGLALEGTGNALNNVIHGNAAANVLSGEAGNDTLDGKAGADTMAGGLGNDIYVVDQAGDVATELAGQGTDTVQSAITWTLGANLEILTLTGTAAIDGTGNALANVLNGNSAANLLNGGAGADQMFGGLGNDIYIVSDIGDKATETSAAGGFDRVDSSVSFQLGAHIENLYLTGSGNIDAFGNSLSNVILGNSGNNLLSGGADADFMAGGAGNDIYVVDNADDFAMESAAQGTDLVRASLNWTLGANLENLTLTGSADLSGTGNDLNNVITGNAAANALNGGNGNDTLTGNGGADVLTGGAGDDVYVIDGLDTLVELAGGGNDTVQSAQSYTLLAEFEYLVLTGSGHLSGTGNAANNVLTGNSGHNLLDGGAGADNMFGGAGNDTYIVDNAFDRVFETSASGGTDIVMSAVSFTLGGNVENLSLTGSGNLTGIGNDLANIIGGNVGNDTLIGGLGADRLEGGGGNDVFLYRSTAESTAVARDTIGDFVSGDRIDLSQIDAVSATAGTNDPFTFIGTAAFSNVAGELRADFVGSEWIVEADTDGDGQADLVIGVTTAEPAILAADFVL